MALSKNEKDFYNKIKSRWSKCSPSVNNILGGYGYTNDSDISESKSFLEKILNVRSNLLHFCCIRNLCNTREKSHL